MNKWIREDLKDYAPYNATAKPTPIVLDANESPWNLPAAVRQDMVDWFMNEENLNRYPDTDCIELREALTAFWGKGLTKENIVCGVGSDQLIDYITKAVLMPGDTAVVTTPSFSMYGLSARLNHGNVVAFPLAAENDFHLDEEAFVEFAKANNAKLVFLCTPNNPTGTVMADGVVRRIAEALDCVVVVDEAYNEFQTPEMCEIPEQNDHVIWESLTLIPWVHTLENVIVLRTFSKAYGLAGARIGYSVSHPALAEAINIVRAPYNVPTISQRLALSVLSHMEEYRPRIAELTTAARRLWSLLVGIPHIKLYSSEANFVYFETEVNVSAALEAAGIRARVFQRGEREKIRLSSGTEEQNDLAFRVIYECVRKRG